MEFVALIYLSYVKKKVQDAGLFEKWTLQGLFDKLDTIERFESPEHGRLLGRSCQEAGRDLHSARCRSTLVITGNAGS